MMEEDLESHPYIANAYKLLLYFITLNIATHLWNKGYRDTRSCHHLIWNSQIMTL